jgi:uncharacterized protein YyaL (SSP411 family)
MMLAALSTYHAGMSQIVIAGDRSAEQARALMDVARRRYLPFAVTVPLVPTHWEAIGKLLPWTAAMALRAEQPIAYVCRDFACLTPASSPDELASQLAAHT